MKIVSFSRVHSFGVNVQSVTGFIPTFEASLHRNYTEYANKLNNNSRASLFYLTIQTTWVSDAGRAVTALRRGPTSDCIIVLLFRYANTSDIFYISVLKQYKEQHLNSCILCT